MNLTGRIRNKMMTERLMFVYRGVVTSENSVPLLLLLEKEMQNSEFGFVGRKRLFMFVLESLQNVTKNLEKGSGKDMSMVIYSKTDLGYTVTTGNVIRSTHIDYLKKKLEEINEFKSRETRDVYRQIFTGAEFSDNGGAGLGLIEMAINTGNKLDYDIVPIDMEHSYFILSKTVDPGGVGKHLIEKGHSFNGKAVAQLERIMAENNAYLIWMGHISPDLGKEVLSFTETKLIEEDVESNLRKRVFSILVEILENVEKYSPGRDAEEQFGMPVALVRLENKEYVLTTGNLILNDNVGQLKEKIDYINACDKNGLKELFRESLSGQTLETDSTGNMGLIDMAIKSGSKLVYEFEKINMLYSY
jgi:hypothetical protein